jgi:putative heme transporter
MAGETAVARSEGVAVSPTFAKIAAYAWRFLVIAVAAYFIVNGLVRLRLIVLPVVIALFLSTLLAPPAYWLTERGLPHWLSTWLVVIASIGLLIGAFVFVAPQVAGELDQMGQDIRGGSEQLIRWASEGPLNLSEDQVRNFVDQAGQRLRDSSSTIAHGALAGAIKVIELIAATLLMLVITFFFVKDGRQMWDWVLKHFNERHREDLRAVGKRGWTTLGAYIRGTALIALIDAVLIGIALILVGVPLAAPLILLTFIGGFFPVIGAFVAGLVAVLVALSTGGFIDALIIAVVITLIQQLEGDLLQPLIMGRVLKLHPVVVLLALTAGGILAGVAGAFLAVPTTAVAATVGNYYRTRS